MDVTIERAGLLPALYLANGIATNTPLAITYSNVLLDAQAATLTVTAINGHEALSIHCPMQQVARTGLLAVNAQRLYQLVRGLADGPVRLQLVVGGKRLQVSAGGAIARLPGVDGKDFPQLPTDERAPMIEIPASTLLAMLSKVGFAVTHPKDVDKVGILGGVLFDLEAGHLRLAATDSYRLAIADSEVPATASLGVLPVTALEQLRRLLEESPKDQLLGLLTGVGVTGAMQVRSPTAVLTMKLLEGEYPDYRRGIPDADEEQMGVARFKVSALLTTIKRAQILAARGAAIPITIKYQPGTEGLFLTCVNADTGELEETVPATYTGATAIDINYNGEFLVQHLQALGEDAEVLATVRGPRATTFVNAAGADSLQILMPRRY